MLDIITTRYGKLRGVQTVVENVTEFRGVPYAQAPVGDWRWRAPREPLPWDGIREFSRYAPGCWQPVRPEGSFYREEFYTHRFHRYPIKWSEDCLCLNIWTPAKTPGDRLPVFVWIHGGGYTQGYSHEPRSNGEMLASNGLVVVSLNYRLNVFGFFAHPELSGEQGGHCGNYAILDQAAALKWIHENIEAFGGDPDNITICGQSAGSVFVQCLSVMEQTKGLFRRAIMQSGTLLSLQHFTRSYKSLEDAEKTGLLFADFAGKKNLKELREIPADKLLDLFSRFRSATGLIISAFCEDGAVFKENPGLTFMKGGYHIDSLIAGSTEWETKLMPVVPGPSKAVSYPFAYNLLNTVPVLCGRLGLDGKCGYWYNFQRKVPGTDDPGAFHSADIWYAFGNLHKRQRPWTYDDFALERLISRYWANFAKAGDPNGEGLPRWDPCTLESVKGMAFDAGKNTMTDLFAEREEGFDSLYQSLSAELKKTAADFMEG